ncbi:MAG: hypothetical protein JWP68_600 [Modestobacter sp.]|nr:hypothetical protein [Modestobacter sp.]
MATRRADMFLEPGDDPRQTEGTGTGDEKQNLVEYIRYQRQTLELKCSGLDAEQLATRSVPPSTMSLLGLVRHMADVERGWFRRILAGEDAPGIYRTEEEPDGDFDGAVGDPVVVAQAWARLHEEQAFADAFIEASEDLSRVTTYDHGQVSLRELLVHIVEEYARHNGHADLLRERIDGATGD